jgi:N-acetylglucosaminyldiphosphoundecaprenol N-acetyl-beta-D-mannosaminyltransferase
LCEDGFDTIFLCGLAVVLFLVSGYLGMDKHHILGSKVNLVSCNKATQKVLDWAGNQSSHYVCLANAHMIMEAYDSKKFWEILNAADLTLPDGMSLVGSLRILGVANQEQVCGRNLTLSLCEQAAKREIAVGFYGSSNKVLDNLARNLRQRYPNLSISYIYSPPFRPLSCKEEEAIIRDINASKARILFVGLGCPKQEYWMAKHKKHFQGVMVGVGAAFDFLSGTKPSPPRWLQNMGLEWLFRLFLEPRRLWYRNLWNNPRFILFFALQITKSFFLLIQDDSLESS